MHYIDTLKMEQMFSIGFIFGAIGGIIAYHIHIKMKERHEKNKAEQGGVLTSSHPEKPRVDNSAIDKMQQRFEDFRTMMAIENAAEKYVKNNNYKKPESLRIPPPEVMTINYIVFDETTAKFANKSLAMHFWDEVVKLEKIYETNQKH